MTSDEEKDPPVPGDLVGASKRIHRVQPRETGDGSDREVPADKPSDRT
ncbi:hypothetical protein [Pseudarthrobacter sp. NPDC059871]